MPCTAANWYTMPSSALANLATYLYFYAAGEVGIDGEDVNYPRIRPMNRHWSELSEAFTPSFVLPLRASSKEGVWESFILSSSSTHPTLSDTFITHIHQVGPFRSNRWNKHVRPCLLFISPPASSSLPRSSC